MSEPLFEYEDKNGAPISEAEWQRLRKLPRYYQIAHEYTPLCYTVSTVWIGDRSVGVMFESAVIYRGDFLDEARYETLEEAQAGHERLRKKWSDPVQDAKRRLVG